MVMLMMMMIMMMMINIAPTNYHLLAAQQEPYQTAHLFTKNVEEFSEKKAGGWASRQKRKKEKSCRLLGCSRAKSSNLASDNRSVCILWRFAMLLASIANVETLKPIQLTSVSGIHGCLIILIEIKPEIGVCRFRRVCR